MKPGFYWVKLDEVEDWEPGMFNGEHWVLLGTGVLEDEDPEVPRVIGERIEAPE